MPIKYVIFSAFISIFNTLSSFATSEQNHRVGFSPLAIAHKNFNCEAFLDSISERQELNIAWLYNTFGSNYKCLRKILTDPRLKILQTYLINEPGHRNKRLENHEFLFRFKTPQDYSAALRKQDKKLRRDFFKYVRSVQNLLKHRQDQVTCLISPGLESNISPSAARVLIRWTRKAFPNCAVVWNPVRYHTEKIRKTVRADFSEGHGSNIKLEAPCIVNLDGEDIEFKSRKTKNPNKINVSQLSRFVSRYTRRNCTAIFLWMQEYNCNDPKNSKFQPPLTRKCVNTSAHRELKRELRKF